MPKVSVIMPSLNMVNYIRQAIESVQSQTLQDIEILCVDAGSTDGTWEILEEYVRTDQRVRLIRSEKKSYGYQMNLGIREATGEYIGIVETDDWIEPDMYQELYAEALKHDAWVVRSNFDMFTTGKDGVPIFANYSLNKYNGVPYGVPYSCEKHLCGEVSVQCYIWNAIYKRSFLEKYQIRFNESPGAAFQDLGFKYQVAFQAERIVAVDRSFYRYRRDNINSSTYHRRDVEFNLAEAKFLLSQFEARGIQEYKIRSALARAIVNVFWSHLDLLKWGPAPASTTKALEEYQTLFRYFMEEDLLQGDKIPEDFWLCLHLLLEDVELYMKYASILAGLNGQKIRFFLNQIREYKTLVIFGCGMRGTAACLLMLNNADRPIVFCDNNKETWGSVKMGIPVVPPMEAVKKYPDAGFIISSPKFQAAIAEQLKDLGVASENILTYRLGTDPVFCTNCTLKHI